MKPNTLLYTLALVGLFQFSFAQVKIDIVHLDIGQGDATLIISHLSKDSLITILFDAGGYSRLSTEDAGEVIHKYCRSANIHRIDYVIISHYDADHIGGIVDGGRGNIYETSFIKGLDNTPNTMDDIQVKTFVDRGINDPPSSKIFQRYTEIANSTNRISLSKPDGFEIKLGDRAKMICLAANGYVKGMQEIVPKVNTENERSLSFLLDYDGFHYLISGDMIGRVAGKENAKVEIAVGNYIKMKNIRIDVLHVNHHGAANGSDPEFLNAIEPEYAVISCGMNNSHNHPTTKTLQDLVDAGVLNILQTNHREESITYGESIQSRQIVYDGHITISSDGRSFVISPPDNKSKGLRISTDE